MKTKQILLASFIAITSSIVSVVIFTTFFNPQPINYQSDSNNPEIKLANLLSTTTAENMNFIVAANQTVHSVVHVKTQQYRQQQSSIYDFFFGQGNYNRVQPIVGSGSGVIISKDGYIVTNNHVINGANYIEVVLNDKRTYPAKLIGTDPYTDIALLKIEEDNLTFINYGNSDDLSIGEWVLAIGNPFNLTSTVTAGIVSAKARDINISANKFAIESFIQTDAAVNPGNSGGALVNTKGELIGINTAIASNTGTFTGYSFAIPVNIVKKVVADLVEFGEVQRAYLGISIANIDAALASELGFDKIEGVYVAGIAKDGAADEAGLEQGDIIVKIDNININAVSELNEQISKYRPGDKIKIIVKRNDKLKPFDITLRNKHGSTEIVKNEFSSVLGGTFTELSSEEKNKLRISNGVKIKTLEAGKLRASGIKEGFIVTSINRKSVNSVEDIYDLLNNIEGAVLIEGIYSNGMVAYYAFGM